MAGMAQIIRNDSLDEVDRRIVDLLRDDARIPNSRLAELAGVAPSTCLARVRSLVERGVITGFSAIVSPTALGLGLQALISVSIRTGARQRITEFREDLEHRPEVRQLFFLGASEDFVLHVAVHDTDALREFVVEQLSAHPAVASTRTSLVFQHHENRLSLVE
jgi:DNA-binding Lrp family transcriptional regulator